MTKRDFFRVIIKLFGLFQLLIIIFQGIPNFFQIASIDASIPTVFYASIILIVTVSIFVFLIYKVDTVLDWLKLDQEFDDEFIQFENFNSAQIIKLAVILISGWLILTNVPDFLFQSYQGFKVNTSGDVVEETFNYFSGYIVDYFNWVVSGMNILIGYFMLTNYKKLATWLDRTTTAKQD